MSATPRLSSTSEIEDDKIKFERKNQDYQKEIEEMQNELLGPIAARSEAKLAAYVNEKGFRPSDRPVGRKRQRRLGESGQ